MESASSEMRRNVRRAWCGSGRNRPSGIDEAIWFEAENQLQAEAESRPVGGTASRPYVNEPAKPGRPQTRSRDASDAAAQTRSATNPNPKRTAGKLRNQ